MVYTNHIAHQAQGRGRFVREIGWRDNGRSLVQRRPGGRRHTAAAADREERSTRLRPTRGRDRHARKPRQDLTNSKQVTRR